jgi:peptidoglycan/xylan/chitin deacetylase (PgdA/CDA1 family)
MIFLTGDVHFPLNSWEEKIAGQDIDNTIRYLEVLKRYKIPCTLFINGKLLDEEPEKVKELLKYNAELGGHTYNNFGNLNIFRSYINRKLYGCIYGSRKYQKKDIKKTKEAFHKVGVEIESWRTHSFGSNEKTFEILKENKIKYVSDLLGGTKPFEKIGLIHLPINIPVDVNTIAYGEFKPENRNPFESCTKGRISPDEWFEIIKKRISDNEKKHIPSILLLHPTTMAVIDNFVLFEKVVKFLSRYKCLKISEINI